MRIPKAPSFFAFMRCFFWLCSIPLLVGFIGTSPAVASLSDYLVATPTVQNIIAGGFTQSVNLATGNDWIKYQGGTNLVEKSATSLLTSGLLGSVTRGTFTPTTGYEFTWTGGTPTATGTNFIQTNDSSLANQEGFSVTATGLAAGDYKLELWAARTDDTPFSVELYDRTTFLTRQTVSGDTASDGSLTDTIYSSVLFTVAGVSDSAQLRFIRDTTNGTVGTTPAGDTVLAIGAWRLTSLSTAPLLSVNSSQSYQTQVTPSALGFSVGNIGGSPLQIHSVTPGGADSSLFAVTSFTSPIAASATGTIQFLFTPNDGARNYTSTFSISWGTPAQTTPVTVTVKAYPNQLGKILLIGDSITEGKNNLIPPENGYAWRYFAWKRMLDWNVGHQFTGTRTSNNSGTVSYPSYNSQSFTNRHEAIWGTTVNERELNLDTALQTMATATGTPDTVVIFVGGNGIAQNSTVDNAVIADITADTSSMINMVQGEVNGVPGNPNVSVLLVSILPRFTNGTTPDPRNANGFTALNAQFAALPATQTTSNSKVRYIDAFSLMNDPSYYYDGVHPSAAGADRLAEIIFGTLVPDRDADSLPDAWESLYFPSLTTSDGSGDADHDGIVEANEFIIGSSPTSSNAMPQLSLEPTSETLRFTLPLASGTGYQDRVRRYQIRSSTNLTQWDDFAQGAATGSEITVPSPMNDPRRFYQLNVVLW